MANELGIGLSPLTEKVYLGKQNSKNRTWVGDKKDITQQFMAVLFEYLEPGVVRDISTFDLEGNERHNLLMNVPLDKKNIRKTITYLEGLEAKL